MWNFQLPWEQIEQANLASIGPPPPPEIKMHTPRAMQMPIDNQRLPTPSAASREIPTATGIGSAIATVAGSPILGAGLAIAGLVSSWIGSRKQQKEQEEQRKKQEALERASWLSRRREQAWTEFWRSRYFGALSRFNEKYGDGEVKAVIDYLQQHGEIAPTPGVEVTAEEMYPGVKPDEA